MGRVVTPKQRQRRKAYTVAIVGTLVVSGGCLAAIAIAGFPATNWGAAGYVGPILGLPLFYNGLLRFNDTSIELRTSTYASEQVRIDGQLQLVQRHTGSSTGTITAGRAMVMWLLGLGFMIGGTGLVVARGAAPPRPPRATKATPPPEAVSRLRTMFAAPSFGEALAIATPEMTDATVERPDDGAALFVTYASTRLRWEDVDGEPETSTGRVMKEPAAERGKRMCASGELLSIVVRAPTGGRSKTYVGQLRTMSGDVVTFVAVRSTGDLVKGSAGSICGIVTGKAGETSSLVGMFDLPENRSPVVERP